VALRDLDVEDYEEDEEKEEEEEIGAGAGLREGLGEKTRKAYLGIAPQEALPIFLAPTVY